ncbi:MAG: hypothetical protein ACI8RD_011490, partial [Bacillariaceae sp.]
GIQWEIREVAGKFPRKIPLNSPQIPTKFRNFLAFSPFFVCCGYHRVYAILVCSDLCQIEANAGRYIGVKNCISPKITFNYARAPPHLLLAIKKFSNNKTEYLQTSKG